MATTAKRRCNREKPHHKPQAPSRLCSIDSASVHLAAQVIAARVKSIGNARCCCAFVFVRSGDVYVISEESSAALKWSNEHFDEWVGCYGGTVSLNDLISDLADHIRPR